MKIIYIALFGLFFSSTIEADNKHLLLYENSQDYNKAVKQCVILANFAKDALMSRVQEPPVEAATHLAAYELYADIVSRDTFINIVRFVYRTNPYKSYEYNGKTYNDIFRDFYEYGVSLAEACIKSGGPEETFSRLY